jgi:hypothetical protein
LAHQVVQIRSLEGWAKPNEIPAHGDWDSFLFVGVFLFVLVCLRWLGRVTLRAALPRPKTQIPGSRTLLPWVRV